MKTIQSTLLASLLTLVLSAVSTPSFALTTLTNDTINDALRYGMENQGLDRSLFFGGNWREGANGALLNIYTPFIQIARLTANTNFSTSPTQEDVQAARTKLRRDIDYIWLHQNVKFMISMYGDSPNFAGKYYAMIEGVGRGRKYTLYPTNSIVQYTADKDEQAVRMPYTAVNSYVFNFDDIAVLDEYTLKLYGKGVEPVTFRILNNRVQ